MKEYKKPGLVISGLNIDDVIAVSSVSVEEWQEDQPNTVHSINFNNLSATDWKD